MAGLGANFEFDLKKIIALSTLRQLGLMIITISHNSVPPVPILCRINPVHTMP
jgi:NADH:ubiquinone oxidoreductase subunit 5 (subunit L)/multisubunit Na+/H+ antiporter MnhA subunit